MSELDLESVITEAVHANEEDAALADTSSEALEASESSTPDPTPTDTTEAPTEPTQEATEAPKTEESVEVASPTAKQEQAESDQRGWFDKKLGVPSKVAGGRENRIPYSRVTKIVENAEKRAIEPLNAKIAELEPKVADYEARLTKVAEFENVMMNDQQRFLGILQSIPAYQPFFTAVRSLQQENAQLKAQLGNPTTTPQTPVVQPDENMPEPDETLSDGSKVYSLDGLKKLMAWQAAQVENRVRSEFEQKLAPFEQERKTIEQRRAYEARVQAAIPQVQRQIEEARQWPLFTENEDAITQALNANPNLSLEGAYRLVVLPKFQQQLSELQPQRDKMRAELLAELKKQPTSTSAPSRPTIPNTQPTGSPASLEDAITQALDAKFGKDR